VYFNLNNSIAFLLVIYIAIFTLSSPSLFAACEGDKAKLKEAGITALLLCGTKSLSIWQEVDANAFAECFTSGYKISKECSACIGKVASCANSKCVGRGQPCGILGTSATDPGCGTCVETKCGDDFQACAGKSITVFGRELLQ